MALLPCFGQETVTLSGFIRTPCRTPVPGVEVLDTITDANGFYSVELQAGQDYSISPQLNGGWLDGVDHNDLMLFAQYILGPPPLGSPYLMIAADVDNSSSISTLDALWLSQLLDGAITSVPGNASWRFVPEDYVFPLFTNPWFEVFPDVVNINNVPGDSTATEDIVINFIGIKVGDLDCSASPWPGPVGQLAGKILKDENGDCQPEVGETGLEDWVVTAASSASNFYATTNANGQYHLTLPTGNYQVSVAPPNPLWGPCISGILVSIPEDSTIIQNVPVQPIANCPYLEVDISPINLRRCITNTYQVRYCNSGTVAAENAQVKVTFDNNLNVMDSSLPWSSVIGQTYTFPIGNIPAGSCGSFSIQTWLSCDALPGQTHCVEAHIFPDSLCVPPPGPLLQMEGNCTGDSVQFRIINLGNDMPDVRHFIVIEDDLVMFSRQLQLGSGETFELSLPANGATQRLQLEPPSGPGGSPSGLAVEACGATGPEGPSLGFVTQYPTEAGNPFININCRENTGPYDPNDKQAFPRGQGGSRHLHPATSLEYLIRFQNTGTDTAFLVVIRDTLPTELNPASLRPGAASHPYTYTLRANGVAEFRFDNILLPDSSTNLEGSQGFIQFYIEQQPGNPNGAIIENSAAIYFDFNEPVLTNFAWHTVDDLFLLPQLVSLQGSFSTEEGLWLGDDMLTFLIRNQDTIATDTNGGYHFDFLLPGQTYTVVPYGNYDYSNGVTTFDLALLYKHILGVQPLGSPYKLLAADVNCSGSVSTLDMVALRRMILAINTQPYLDDKPAWRFVRADYVFPDPNNPWLEPIPSTAVFEQLMYDSGVDFIGIKVGDLNGDVIPGPMGRNNRSLLPLYLEVEQRESVLKYQAVPAVPGEWIAYQMELQLPVGAALHAIRAGTERGELAYSLSEMGRLRLCWFHTEAVRFAEGAPLFTLELGSGLPAADQKALELIPGFSQAFTAEGQSFELALDKRKEWNGLHVFPNPGSGVFTLSGNFEAPEVHIRIYGLAGRMVYQAVALGGGNWKHRLPEAILPAGIYTVEAHAGGQRWVERLVVGRE